MPYLGNSSGIHRRWVRLTLKFCVQLQHWLQFLLNLLDLLVVRAGASLPAALFEVVSRVHLVQAEDISTTHHMCSWTTWKNSLSDFVL